MPLDGIDEMPQPGGGISLLTPLYGRVPPRENVTLVGVEPLEGVPPLARYRVTGIADNLSPQPPGYYVAIGPSDYGVVGVPRRRRGRDGDRRSRAVGPRLDRQPRSAAARSFCTTANGTTIATRRIAKRIPSACRVPARRSRPTAGSFSSRSTGASPS